jgi:hypothetical protein
MSEKDKILKTIFELQESTDKQITSQVLALSFIKTVLSCALLLKALIGIN